MALEVNQEVCFLSQGSMLTGTIKRIGLYDTLILIDCNGVEMYANREFVAAIDAKFCVVQSDNQAYTNDSLLRFDFTTYRHRNKTWEHWVSREGWIREYFDPYELRDKATVYGLEI